MTRAQCGFLAAAALFFLTGCAAESGPAANNMVAAGAVAPNAAMQAVLDPFKSRATPEQYREVSEAIGASPALTQQLNEVAQTHRLTAIEIASPGRKPTSPFPNTIDHGVMIFTADFLVQAEKRRLFDVVQPNDVLPNNLVFVLGSLAYHLQSPPPPVAQFSNPQSFAQARVARDAHALIVGWNDVVDAATKENGGKPLTVAQQGSLLVNLRYRAVFVTPNSRDKIVWSPTGAIAPTDANVAAVAEILGGMRLLDFGA